MQRTKGIKDHRVGMAAVPKAVINDKDFVGSSSRPKIRGNGKVYDDTIPGRIYLMACLGSTQLQMGQMIGVDVSTVNIWINKHPECMEQYEAGKLFFEAGMEKSVIQRALGYMVKETRTTKGKDKNGQPIEQVTVSEKHIPGDPSSQQFWLKNKKPDEWQELSKVQRQSHTTIDLQQTLNLPNLSSPEIKLVKSLCLKTIAEDSGISTD